MNANHNPSNLIKVIDNKYNYNKVNKCLPLYLVSFEIV